MALVDQAIYRDGKRVPARGSFREINELCSRGEGIVWLGIYRPGPEEFAEVAREYDLHPLAVEDAVKAHQRPKLEHYDDTLFLVLRPAHYVKATERVEFGELHVFAGPHFVITIRHSEAPDLALVRKKLETRPDLLVRGTGAIVHAIVDRIVDDYERVVDELQLDIDETEDDVFDGSPMVSKRIYELSREVIAFQRATNPLAGILEVLMEAPDIDEEESRYLRDVEDHALRVQEDVAGFRELLQNILNVNLTLETKALSQAANRTNEEVKKISAWAAIFFAPTFIGTIYGMNFTHMPELDWAFGYPLALLAMAVVCVGLYAMFKRRNWI